MLSILIPTYNFSVTALVNKLQEECMRLGINYEIIVSDDASENVYDNGILKLKDRVHYFYQEINLGRSKSRNFLASKAQYEWILFLDADVLPKNTNFVASYLAAINPLSDLIFGGLSYSNVKPEKTELLRWNYGHKKEALTYHDRLTKKPQHFLCSNALIHKKVFKKIKFNEELTKYGYEDLIFEKEVVNANFRIIQIDNPVLHLKLDTSYEFISKTEEALQNLKTLINNQLLNFEDTGISAAYAKLNKFKLDKIYYRLFQLCEKGIKKNLTSSVPSMTFFNFYRLYYFTKNQF